MMKNKWLNIALWLAVITVIYNLIEGIVSVWFGLQDSTIASLRLDLDIEEFV